MTIVPPRVAAKGRVCEITVLQTCEVGGLANATILERL
jgi:hypothetical protein